MDDRDLVFDNIFIERGYENSEIWGGESLDKCFKLYNNERLHESLDTKHPGKLTRDWEKIQTNRLEQFILKASIGGYLNLYRRVSQLCFSDLSGEGNDPA